MSVNEKMTAIADAIRGYGSITGKLNLDEMANKIGTVYLNGYDLGRVQGEEAGFSEGVQKGYGLGFEEGKAAEREKFWERFQNKGEARAYYYAFSYNRFDDETYNPRYVIVCNSSGNAAQNMFYNSTLITDTKVPIDARATSHIGAIFYNAKGLKTVCKLIVNSGVKSGGNNAFYGCSSLENIAFEGEIALNIDFRWSTFLKKASIESIINALSAKESGLTVTLSETAVNNAFTAEEWDALEATKTNWTISLV